jgi:hypothetical protein
MPFDEAHRGDPFQDDFPYWPDDEALADLRALVQSQAGELARLRQDQDDRQRYLRLLQRRRQPQQNDASARDGVVAQFDFLPVREGFDTLVVPGELLITRQSYEGGPGPARGEHPGRYAKDYLDDFTLKVSEVDCDELENRVLRLTPTRRLAPQELAEAARALRDHGYAVSVHCIVASAGVVKPPPTPNPPPPPPPPPGGGEAVRLAEVTAGSQPAAAARPLAPLTAVVDTGSPAGPRPDGRLGNVRPGGRPDVRRDRNPNIDPLDMFPLPDGDGYLDFSGGHGTSVCGVISQIAPGADIAVYRAVDGDGLASEVTVAREMIRAVKQDGARIVNLSLGGQTQDDVPPVAIQQALEIIREWEYETGQDVIIVAAAGNYADTRPCWPAAFRQVVSVAGLAPGLLPAAWSSQGPTVDLSTVGQGVCSTFAGGTGAPEEYPEYAEPPVFGPDAFVLCTGTSFTAAQVTGALARLYRSHGYEPREALRRLLDAGQPVPGYGRALKILPGV